jgi:hypothetical protein
MGSGNQNHSTLEALLVRASNRLIPRPFAVKTYLRAPHERIASPAIVVNLKPRSLVARQSFASVRMAERRISNRPSASIRVNQAVSGLAISVRWLIPDDRVQCDSNAVPNYVSALLVSLLLLIVRS